MIDRRRDSTRLTGVLDPGFRFPFLKGGYHALEDWPPQ
jgi:hypothetical protein